MKNIISRYSKQALCRLSAVMLVLTIAMMSFVLTVSAVKKQEFTLDSTEDIEIIILYDGDAPALSVKSPEKTYSKDADYTKVDKKSGVTYLYIKDAPSGKWTIDANKDIDFNVLRWYGNISVSSFTNTAPKNDKITVKATVKSDDDVYYSWEIYAVADSSITGSPQKIKLADGSSAANKENSRDISIKQLPDGEWKLTMEAYVDRGNGIESDAFAETAQTFKVTGHTTQGDASKIVTNVDIAEQIMYVDWSKVETRYDSMLVSAVNKDGELLCYDSIDKKTQNTSFLADSDVTLRLMPMYNGQFTEMYTLKLTYAPKVKVSIDTPELTGDLMVQISYDAGDANVPADITLNGKNTSYNLTGQGTMSLPLEQMSANNISVTYRPSANEEYTISKTINVQSLPAYVEFFGIKDRLVTAEPQITICGRTDPGAKLMLGENEIKVEESGDFAAEAKLEQGENVLTFNIESPMGIRTTRTVTVVRTSNGGTATAAMNNADIPWWVQLVFGAAVVILSIAGIFIGISMSKKKKNDTTGKVLLSFRIFLIICFTLFIAAGAFCLYQCIKVSSTISGNKLIERLESNDYDGLDTVLSLRDTWLSRMITLFVLAGICAVIFVLTIFIGKWLKKRRKKPKTPKPPKQKKPREPKASAMPAMPVMPQENAAENAYQMPQQPVDLQKPAQPVQDNSQAAQQYAQQPMQYPQQYPQQPMQYPQQYPQQPVQHPQQYTQQPMQYPQQYTQQPMQYPQQYTQQPVQYPQQYTQGTTPQNDQNSGSNQG